MHMATVSLTLRCNKGKYFQNMVTKSQINIHKKKRSTVLSKYVWNLKDNYNIECEL